MAQRDVAVAGLVLDRHRLRVANPTLLPIALQFQRTHSSSYALQLCQS